MISIRKTGSALGLAALMATGVIVATAAPAAARVVCNRDGDCWHTDGPAPVVPGITFNTHPDDWYFHQHWDGDRDHHYRDYHDGHGYYRGGVWVQL